MKTLQDLFEHQIKDLYSAETQLVEVLPNMIEKAHDSKLKNVFKSHLEETMEHKIRLETISRELNITPKGETCKAMEGLIKEVNNFIDETGSEEVMDAGLIAQPQRVEHYEISGYGTTVRFAKEIGHRDIAKRLQETLDEEYDTDNKLDKLAEGRLNKKAISDV